MVALITCKNKEDTIKNEGARMLTTYTDFQKLKGSYLHSPWSDLAEFEVSRNLMVVLITCKNGEDRIKNEGVRMLTTFSPL